MTKRLTHIIITAVAAALVAVPVSAIAASGSGSAHAAKAASGTPKCVASQLRVSIVDREGAAGTTYWNMALQNAGSSSCHMVGYPGLGLVDSQSRLINVLVVRNPITVPRWITLRPGQSAYFTIGYPSLIGACTSHFSASGVQVIPPNTFQRIVFRTGTFDVCTPSSAVANPQVWPLRTTPHFEA